MGFMGSVEYVNPLGSFSSVGHASSVSYVGPVRYSGIWLCFEIILG